MAKKIEANALDHIKHGLAQQKGFDSLEDLLSQWTKDFKHIWIDIFYTEVAKIYANSKLEEAAECATTYDANEGKCGGMLPPCHFVDKQSILNLREEV